MLHPKVRLVVHFVPCRRKYYHPKRIERWAPSFGRVKLSVASTRILGTCALLAIRRSISPAGQNHGRKHSLALQTEAYEECLQTYFLTTCFDNNGTTVGCGSEVAIDSFQMPDW